MSKELYRTIKRKIDVTKMDDSMIEYFDQNILFTVELYNMAIDEIRDMFRYSFTHDPKDKTDKTWPGVERLITSVTRKYKDIYGLDTWKYFTSHAYNGVSRRLKMMVHHLMMNKKWYDTVEDKYRYRSYNPRFGSFSFDTTVQKRKYGAITSKVKNVTENSITIMFNERLVYTLYIVEPSFDNRKSPFKRLRIENIRWINIKRHNGEYYIMLECRRKVSRPYKDAIKSLSNTYRKKCVGIDLGERNMIVCYDGEYISKIEDYFASHPINNPFPYDKIDKYLRKIDALMSIRKAKIFNSKNYIKLCVRICDYYSKIFNTRNDWQYKAAHHIVKHYNTIICDEFYVPITNKNEFGKKSSAAINRRLRMRAMSYFIPILRHMSEKYGCRYIRANEGTSVICSRCGERLPAGELPLSVRVFECEECGAVMDRDINAAINCYNQFDDFVYTINV